MKDALERPNVLRALTGLDPEEFHRLSAVFTEEWERETERNWEGQPRHYPKGVGPKGALDTTEVKLLFILMYLRVYPTQEVMGFFYGFNQCQANKWIMRLLPVLRRALERLAALPVRQPAALEQILARCQDLKLRLDGVERPIRRPKDPEKQRACYSGRKKRHTVKNLVLEQERSVEFLSPTAPRAAVSNGPLSGFTVWLYCQPRCDTPLDTTRPRAIGSWTRRRASSVRRVSRRWASRRS